MRLTLQLFLLLTLSFRSTGLHIPLEGECVITPSESNSLTSCAVKPEKAGTAVKGALISAGCDSQCWYIGFYSVSFAR